jgi:hypothetical protein
MIEMYEKATGRKVIIYDITEDGHGYAKFLVRKNGAWVWRSAKHYIPVEENLI